MSGDGSAIEKERRDAARRGCVGCVHFRGVVWVGDAQRIKCGQTDGPFGYADARVMIYAGCGLRETADDIQTALW
jgi:hypothetical protein